MKPKIIIKAYDGTTLTEVQQLNLPAGSVGEDGTVDLGLGVKVYRALLTQSGTDAPVATVLENTLGGTVVWTRNIAGSYRGTLTGAFPTDQTMVTTANNDNGGNGGAADYTLYQTIVTTNFIIVVSRNLDIAGGSVTPADDLLTDYPIQILVYP